MKHENGPRSPIESFPIAWAQSLPDILGSIAFEIEHSASGPFPRMWMGVVSSHSSRHGYAIQEWQDSLQSALQLAMRQHWGILCARNAPYADIIVHACNRYAIPCRVLQIDSDETPPVPAIDHAMDQAMHQAMRVRLFCKNAENSVGRTDIPIHDRAVVFLGDKLFVLSLNDGGKIARLLEQRLALDSIPAGTTYLAIPNRRTERSRSSVRMDWLERGVVGWLNPPSAPDPDEGFTTIVPNTQSQPETQPETHSDTHSDTYSSPVQATYQPILPIHLLASSCSQYLIHCTRSRLGPWPDQSLSQFHDELLHRPWKTQPTVLQSLTRILQLRRLIATHAYRRSDIATVCFSGNSISDLMAMRCFRSHLARWDWEPYGIMIERGWLVEQGAKKVTYIDRVAAKSKTSEELAFSQIVSKEPTSTDWSEEQEWRFAGDLRLNAIPFSKAIVFVPTLSDAMAVQPISPWPIAIVTI